MPIAEDGGLETGDAGGDVDSPWDAHEASLDASQDSSDGHAPEAGSCSLDALRLTLVAEGLAAPLFLTSHTAGADLLILEQTGSIRVLAPGGLLPEPFLDLASLASTGGERGLLGLALHPSYEVTGRFFLDYTNTAGNTVVAEYRRSATDPRKADPQPVRELLTVAQPFANHNGGMLAFGPDGYLYIAMGDGGGGGDPQGNGQNPAVKLGKLLRIDVDAYPAPAPGNMPGADPDVWDMGLRNPWRFSFDRLTGDLYIADVGQGSREEVNFEPQGAGHRNYGWNVMEGSQCHQPASGCPQDGLTLPVAEYGHDLGCSITGGYVYRGSALGCLQGRYLYADYCSGRVESLVVQNGLATDPLELTAVLDPGGDLLQGVSSFGEDGAGEPYVVSSTGRVFRIEATPAP